MNDDTIAAKNQPNIGHALLRYIPPEPSPQSGFRWPDFEDYPGIEAILYIPSEFAPDVSEAPRGSCLYGEYRTSSHFRAATLAEAEEKAEAWLADGCRVLARAIDARASRLARRDATISNAHAKHNRVRPPQ